MANDRVFDVDAANDALVDAQDPPDVVPAEEDIRCTDVGNSRRLVRRFGGRIRYCPEMGWLTWDGSRWMADNRGRVKEMAKAVAQEILDEGAELNAVAEDLEREADSDDKEMKERIAKIRAAASKRIAWGYASESGGKQRAMVDLAQSAQDVVAERAQFDTAPELLNLRDCVVNLRTGERLDHDPSRLMMHRAEAAWATVPVGKTYKDIAPRFMAFLAAVTQGDVELAAYLQRAVGVSMCGHGPKNRLFICHGMGANGKSTFIGVIATILGSYAVNTRVETFVNKGGFDQIPVDVATLAGARMVTMAEPEAGDQLASGLVKEILGERSKTARFMRRDPFTFTPTCSPWLSCNHKLIIRDNSDGTWRRMALIPWKHKFEEKDQVEHYDQVLLDAERDGILAWMLDGAREYLAHGLKTPASVVAAVAAYREEMDLLGEFVGEYMERGDTPRHVTAYQDAWQAFKVWAKDNGEDERRWSTKRFTRELADRGIKRAPGKAKGQPLMGVRLVKTAEGAKMASPPAWLDEPPPPTDDVLFAKQRPHWMDEKDKDEDN